MTEVRRPWSLLLLAGSSIVVLRALRGGLEPPPGASPARFAAGVDTVGAASALCSLVRLGAIAAAAYLTLVSAIAITASVSRSRPLGRLAVVVSVGPVRRLVATSLGLSLTFGAITQAGAAIPPGPPSSGPPVMAVVDADPAAQTGATEPEPPPTMVVIDAAGASNPGVQVAAEVPASHSDVTHIVRAGECLWSIAADALATTRGAEPSAAQVVPYWLTLIDANRDRLLDRDNPDLILPGQIFTLPPVGAAAGAGPNGTGPTPAALALPATT